MLQRVRSGAIWESKYGYCRAVRVADQIWVSGTVAVDEDKNPYAPGDAEAQTKRALEIVRKAIEELGGHIDDVVRTRMFVVDLDDAKQDAIGRAHGVMFKDFPPAATMVGVAALIDPVFIVEIEADALIQPR
jgi:enamine deaminase RidA (YjgF/YER057c/UK114 family)